ncbi:MAG TPA: hypothetical protein VFG52_02295, partial [Xanthomonadales bacterium]|nr:hypothetical protein [Xanthomonadales bacterium]
EAYYAALFELLVDYEEIPQGALGTLAKYRAQAVIDGLARQGVSRHRLTTPAEAEVSEARVDGVPVSLKLELGSEPGDESAIQGSGPELGPEHDPEYDPEHDPGRWE